MPIMKPKHPIVLASASPRRRELLGKLFREFEVLPSEVAEHDPGPEYPRPCEHALTLARAKAQAVAAIRPNHIVIGADTVVSLEGILLGKPTDSADAARILKTLSGKTHQVVTGVVCCLIDSSTGEEKTIAACEETTVEFRRLTDADIMTYVATNEPMDKAGAYAIQGGAARFVRKVVGDIDNVVGLPIAKLRSLLITHGLAEH